MRRPAPHTPRPAALAVVCVLGALVWSGCAATSDSAANPSRSTASASPSAPPAVPPTLVAEGSAAENLPLFTAVMDGVWASEQRVEGRAYIDALVSAGFPQAEMELTRDRTTVNNPADALQFSVRWAGECLVGQVGPSTPTPTAVVLPEVPGGTCLIGQTRPIDW